MNRIVHLVVKYLYALFLLGSGVKHLYNIYWADASIMATGYPEPEAQAFVTAVLATSSCCLSSAPRSSWQACSSFSQGRSNWACSWPSYALGMLMWGIFMVPSHIVIMSAIFLLNALLVWANWGAYKGLLIQR